MSCAFFEKSGSNNYIVAGVDQKVQLRDKIKEDVANCEIHSTALECYTDWFYCFHQKSIKLDKTCDKSMSDNEIIKLHLANQSTTCFSILYNRYAGKIYSKCISLLKDEALAEDATQEIFTKIFINLSKFAERSKFSTWVYSITYNFCIDFLRRRKKHHNLFADSIERLPDIPDEVVDESLFQMEVYQLKKVLEEIPVDDKAILLMKYQDELSIKEIAAILEKTDSAVKMRIKRAKAKAQLIRSKLFQDEYV